MVFRALFLTLALLIGCRDVPPRHPVRKRSTPKCMEFIRANGEVVVAHQVTEESFYRECSCGLFPNAVAPVASSTVAPIGS